MGTASLAVLGVLLVVLQSPTDAAVPLQDGLSRTDREMMKDEVPVLYLPKATIGLTRKKRQWLIPPINVPENDRGPFPKRVVKIQSDKEKVIYYSITGPGANQEPKNRFTIDRTSGNLYVTQPLDREEISNYTFQVYGVAEGGGTAENPLEIQVFVVDQNDNKPTFTQDTYMGQVAESSPIGFEFIQVTAIDDDEEGSVNADVRYGIMSQDPKSPTDEMFSINPVTGYIQVNALGLDREKNPKYTLEVQAADMEGEGLRGTTKVIITVTDGNNQDPVLVQSQSSADAAVPPQDGLTRMKRETMKDEVSVLYFPKATNGLKRRKREWIIPPINFPENDRGPFPKKVVQIRSSSDKEKVIFYSITGPGADQPPKDLFRMDRTTGNLYVTKPLDREATANYTFQAHAVADGSGLAEKPMEIQVFVIDMNDNNPKFTQDTYMGEVAESSPIGFEFIQVTAIDADEEGNENADIRYSILSQDPKSLEEMFSINPVTGYLRVNALGLDREKIPKYTLEVQAADRVGEGLTGKAKVILTVTDSNDNAPVFEQSRYNGTVAENKKDAFVVKMSVTDGDGPLTPAWNAKFTIIDGNKGGLFSVETAPNKQEGIITTAKGLDFETAATHTLLVTVENEVPFAVPLPTSTATVIVTVQDVNEPPIFEPEVKLVSKPENLPLNSEVVQYKAYDPDRARNQKVMYKIVSDPAGWLNVDKETGLITVKSEMDRESSFVIDNIYTALIGAYDNDEVPATGTGTIQIQLEDVNDNAPIIKEREIKVCNKEPAPHYLTVEDKDGPGFTSPFKVTLEGESKTNWTAEMNNTKTGIILTLNKEIPSGKYTVVLRVADNQGLPQDSTIEAEVCDCTGPDVRCKDIRAGGVDLPVILGVLAGIMLLLMLVLMLLLFARRKRVDQKEPLLQDDIRDNIYYYDEEGGGEDDQDYDLGVLHRGLDNRPGVYRDDVAPNFMPAPVYRPRPTNPDEIGNFIVDNMKAADNDPTAPPYDSLLVFDYEGGGSDAGSLSSLNSSTCGDQDYSCLNDWGPRFKKLADMYGGGEDDDML